MLSHFLLLGMATLLLIQPAWCGGWLSRSIGSLKSSSKDQNTDAKRKHELLPKLLPHDDTSYLIEFHSDNCDHCEQMEPVLQRLEDDLGTKIRRINIFRRREFYGLLEAMGHDECGGLPFYYNRRTGQAICGATSYQNLKKWGMGSVKHLFQDPPEAREPDQEMRASNRKDVGAKQMLTEKMQRMARSRREAGEKKAENAGKSTTTASQDSDRNKKISAAARIAERRAKRDARKEGTVATK